METGGITRYFRCRAVDCGLRFPVVPADLFRGVCPRCGGAVDLVAERAETAGALQPEMLFQPRLQLLLDNWRSCFNVGSIFRTADGAGVTMLHLCGITPTPDAQRKVVKTALGAERAVPWQYHADGERAARALAAAGATIWALEATPGSQAIDAAELPEGPGPLVLVAGNEVAGVDPGILAHCERVIALPMHGVKRSLNVAIALSVATYWLMLRGAARKSSTA